MHRILLTLVALVSTLCLSFLAPVHAASKKNEAMHAVARLNYAGFSRKGHCTAVLIAKSKALTAGHCVDNWPVKDLRLVFGYSKGEWVELRKIRKVHRHNSRDLAVLCLHKPSQLKPIVVDGTDIFGRVQSAKIVGYPRSRSHIQRNKTCLLQASGSRSRFDCPLEPGMSGSPVMMSTVNGMQVVGIASKTSRAYSLIERVDKLPAGGC